MDKWEMYIEIQQLLKQGFSKKRVAEKLGVSRTTLYQYLSKSPQEMALWEASTKSRTKKLDLFQETILFWLREHSDLSAAQVYDWIQERDRSYQISESTVRNYVRELRKIYHLPKVKSVRIYEAVADPPMGDQAQVDFGKTRQKTFDGKEIKLSFIVFVLSHSRYKYMKWLDRPFTTRDVIQAHENAFQFFGGIPRELVYDQDRLMVVSENAGDLILTAEFETYRKKRELILRVCRKADPESKGRIENVVGFVKNNFTKHRLFHHLDSWNEEAIEWLERTGNGKIHHTTKKRPVEVFVLEQSHLRPISDIISLPTDDITSISRTVRKDNTILFESNRYSVPLGTYQGSSTVVDLKITDDEQLMILDHQNGRLLAEHRIDKRKGQLIQNRQHIRDRAKGIDAYISHLAEQFKDGRQARLFLEEVRRAYPRYIRDQLQWICKQVHVNDPDVMDESLNECIQLQLFSASELNDMIHYIKQQRQQQQQESENFSISDAEERIQSQIPSSIMTIPPLTREFDVYLSILEGKPR